MKAIVKEPIFNKKEIKTYVENETIELCEEEYNRLLAKKAIKPITDQDQDADTDADTDADEQPKEKNKKANKKGEN